MAKDILMQRGTALWLTRRTKLTNRQIAEFCNIHEIEVNAFREGLNDSVIEINPIDSFLLSEEQIVICEANSSKKLEALEDVTAAPVRRTINYMRRREVVNAVFWFINNYPDVSDAVIMKLFGCTKNLIETIRDKSYKDYENLVARHPVTVGLCTQDALNKALQR